MAGNRTRINCLEGNYAHHYTTIASYIWFKMIHILYPKFCLFNKNLQYGSNAHKVNYFI
jgi:hypothetical protein